MLGMPFNRTSVQVLSPTVLMLCQLEQYQR